MKSVLIGNGINIQFGNRAYSNEFIMKRIIFNARTGRYNPLFEGTITGVEIETIFKGFLDIANNILKGNYDDLDNPDDQLAIRSFKKRYDSFFEITHEIMLEDWFFLIRLFFINHPDLEHNWQSSKQGFERIILDAIYNEGNISSIHKNMNKKVKRYFRGFDNIFTLNYDCNIEELTGKDVYHLHGSYSVIADSENQETISGLIHHNQKEWNSVIIEGYEHCFCNALLDYSGELKLKRVTDIMKCTEELSKWMELSKVNQKVFEKKLFDLKEKDIESYKWVKVYIDNPTLRCGTDYHFSKLSNLTGELHVIGMSPNNDDHIFKSINKSKLEKVIFYYYSESETSLPITKAYDLIKVNDLWKSLDSENKKYNVPNPIPDSPKIDEIIEIVNRLSSDTISKDEIVNEIKLIPQFEVNRLCRMVRERIIEFNEKGKPRNEDELTLQFNEISRIGLREGVLPSVLYILYIINHNRKQKA